MSADKENIVRQKNVRRSLEDKLKAALERKPTAASLIQKGLTPEQKLNKVPPRSANTNGVKQIINRRGGKRNLVPQVARILPPKINPPNKPAMEIYKVPQWFLSHGHIDVSIIVPMYRSADVIIDQINSWDLLNDGLTKEIIYVNDFCPNNSYQHVLASWEPLNQQMPNGIGQIILLKENCGYGLANNAGVSVAKGKYLIFLNADCTVTRNWIRPMYDMMVHDKNIGIVGNLQLKNISNSIDSAGSEWDWKSKSFVHVGRNIYKGERLEQSFNLKNIPQDLLVPGEREMVTGCCFMIEKNYFEKLGGFDPEYKFAYWEDADLNMKVKLGGKKVMFQPESRIYHKLSHSKAGGHPFMQENQSTFQNRWVKTKLIDTVVNTPRTQNPVKINPESIVIYTAINGGYDKLKEQPNKNVDFVAFLDDNELKSNIWEIRNIHKDFTDLNRNAKIHKVLPHIYFPDKEYSLWIDGSVDIEFACSIEKLIQTYLEDVDLAIFKHTERHCIYAEANTCIQKHLDNADVIRSQIERYTQAKYPANNGLVEATVILRRHTSAIKTFNETWWNEIQNGSKRDQISFNYVAHKLKLKYNFFPNGLRKKNYLFKRNLHAGQK